MAKDDVEDFIEKMGLAKGNYYIICKMLETINLR